MYKRQAIALLPGRQKKKFTVDILHSIEREVSRYVLTISVINTLMGLLFAGILFALDVPLPEALLWGTLVAILNFAPYVGPLIGMGLMLLVGFVSYKDPVSYTHLDVYKRQSPVAAAPRRTACSPAT